MARFGVKAICSARYLAEKLFETAGARAVFAGMAAHSFLPLEQLTTAAFGLVLGISAHAVGWPVARGGSGQIAGALASYFRSLGGEIVTGTPVESLDDLPAHRALLLDVTPRQVLAIAGDALPGAYRNRLLRYRYGPGVFKVDWALSGPIPWKSPECGRAATVHVGGTFDEIAAAERAAWNGQPSAKPFVLLAQQSLFDSSRTHPANTPAGHIATFPTVAPST